jgi:serine beta-lactamase-like protein LACTB, mitochondrial
MRRPVRATMLLVLVTTVTPGRAISQHSDADAARLVRAMAEALRTTAHLPGLSIAVGKGDQIVFAEGFGYADVALRRPVSPSTQFLTASVAKVITATALAKLVQEGRLQLDATVQDYVPTFPVKRWPITPRQLAGHLAGVAHYNASDKLEKRFYTSVEDALGVFAAESLSFEPGTRYAYSTHGFTLLSAVIEGASRTPFLEYIHSAIFGPLGMSATGPYLRVNPGPAMATLYTMKNGTAVTIPDPEDPSYKWAGGGLVSTPTDLVHLAGGYFNGFLKPETAAQMFASQRLRDGRETGVGIAWRNSFDVAGHRVIEHAGSMGGARTVVVMYPESRLAVAIMTNADWSSLVEETAHLMALPFLTRPAPTTQPTGTANVAVTTVKVNGTKEGSTGTLVLRRGGGTLTVGAGGPSRATYPLVYLERANTYALVRPDGVVHLTVEVDGHEVTGKAIGYGSPRLTPPTKDSPFFTFHGTFSPGPREGVPRSHGGLPSARSSATARFVAPPA